MKVNYMDEYGAWHFSEGRIDYIEIELDDDVHIEGHGDILTIKKIK